MNPDLDGWIVPEKKWSSTRLTARSWKWWALEDDFRFPGVFCLRFQPLSFQGVQQNLKSLLPNINVKLRFFEYQQLLLPVFLCFISLYFRWCFWFLKPIGWIQVWIHWIVAPVASDLDHPPWRPFGRVPIPKSKICFLPSSWLLYHNLRSEKNDLSCLRKKCDPCLKKNKGYKCGFYWCATLYCSVVCVVSWSSGLVA